MISQTWDTLRDAVKGFIRDGSTIRLPIIHNLCISCVVQGSALIVYKRMIDFIRSEIKNAEILRGDQKCKILCITNHIEKMRKNLKKLFEFAYPVLEVGNTHIEKKKLKLGRYYKNAVKRSIKAKLSTMSNDMVLEVLHISKNLVEPPKIVHNFLNMLRRYGMFSKIMGEISVSISKEYEKIINVESLDKKIEAIYNLCNEGYDNPYLSENFRSVKETFLSRIPKLTFPMYYELDFSKGFFLELFIKNNGIKRLENEMEECMGGEKVYDFLSLHSILERVQMILNVVEKHRFSKFHRDECEKNFSVIGSLEKDDSNTAVQRIKEELKATVDKIISDLVGRYDEKMILDGISFIFNAVSSGDNCDKFVRSVAYVFKCTSKKDEFDQCFRSMFADVLLIGNGQFVKMFVETCIELGVNRFHINKIQKMLEESESRRFIGKNEILFGSSCYWPNYSNIAVNFSDLNAVKKRFIFEGKKKGGRSVIKFIDAASLCEVILNNAPLILTLIQLKIIKILISHPMNKRELKSKINFKGFDDHFIPLVKNNIVIEVGGKLRVTTIPVSKPTLPKVFRKDDGVDGSNKSAPGKDDLNDIRRKSIVECEIMRILKREKSIKETMLYERLKKNASILKGIVESLIEKAYIKRDGPNLIYLA